MGIRSFVKAFFQGTFAALLTAIADIGRFLKLRAKIFFIGNAGGITFATCPAEPGIRGGTVVTDLLDRTLMQESQTAVVESMSIGTSFVETDMCLYFLGNSSTVLTKMSCNRFKTVSFVK